MLQTFAIYLIIGIITAVFFYFLLNKQFLGDIYGGITIGIIGAILGGYLLNEPVHISYKFIKENFHVNLFSTLIGSIVFVWVFNLVSPVGTRKR